MDAVHVRTARVTFHLMKTTIISLLTILVAAVAVPARSAPDDLVLVKGGTFKNARSNYHDKHVTVADFYIGKHEVTQKEWVEVMGSNPAHFKGDQLPVEMVSWYECIEYCNRRSANEGLDPYYVLDREKKDPNNGNENDDLQWTVTINTGANGYRLPTEAEWEYAAGGGQVSQGHAFSGGDVVDDVAWTWRNAGDEPLAGAWQWPAIERNHNKTREVGRKKPNELGLFDMSGNVREWCWDWYGDAVGDGPNPRGGDRGVVRVWKGGGWLGDTFCCEPSFRAGFEPNGRGYDQGFRVCRNK